MPNKQRQKRTIKLVFLLVCYKKVKNIVWRVAMGSAVKGLQKCYKLVWWRRKCKLNQWYGKQSDWWCVNNYIYLNEKYGVRIVAMS